MATIKGQNEQAEAVSPEVKGASEAVAAPGAAKTVNTSKAAKQKKWLIGGVVGIVVVVLAVLAAIFLPKMLGVSYAESYEVGDELFDKLDNVYGGSKAICYKTLSNADDETISIDDYQRQIDNCKQGINEARDLAQKLAQTAGVKRDVEVKEKYDAFDEAAQPVLMDETKVNRSLAAYAAVHEFLVRMSGYEVDASEAEIREMTEPLVSVENENVKKIGEELRTRMIELGKLYEQFVASGNSDRKIAQAYLEKAEDLEEWMGDLDFDEEEMVDLTSERVNKMLDRYEDVMTIIDEKNSK